MKAPSCNPKGSLGWRLLYLIAASLLALSCASSRQVLLSDDEMFKLATKKLEQSQDATIVWKTLHPKQRSGALALLNELLNRYPESPHASDAQMILAGLYFEAEKYEEAEAEYTVYLRFYPSGPMAQEAHYRLLLTHQRRITAYDRDQTQTLNTLDLCTEHKMMHPDGRFIPLVNMTELEARITLSKHEFYVGRFYYRRHKYAPAASRLRGVLSNYPQTEAASQALYYLAKIDLRFERKDEAIEKLNRLKDQYPHYPYAEKAQRLLKKLG